MPPEPPHTLPEDPWKYFQKVPGAFLVDIHSLTPSRARSRGIANAKVYMWAAYNGEMGKRDPLSLQDNGDGTYTILDGNSTYANAVASGWKRIPGVLTAPSRVAARHLLAMTFTPTPGGKLYGYKVMRWDFEAKEAVSGSDSRQRVSLRRGMIHRMPGVGVFLGATEAYVLRHYAKHDCNVLITYTFDPVDLIQGNLTDREPEISVAKATVVSWEVYDEDGNPV